MNEELICYTAWEFGTRTATYIFALFGGIIIGRITRKNKDNVNHRKSALGEKD